MVSLLDFFLSFQFGTFKVDANENVFNRDGELGTNASEALWNCILVAIDEDQAEHQTSFHKLSFCGHIRFF